MKGQSNNTNGVELFLDNRQVFLLFFASAVILSLVFTLGVVVGKRVERTADAQPQSDPLTLLDQMGGQEVDDNLTFHEALTGGSGASADARSTPPSEPPKVEQELEPQPQPDEPNKGAAPAALASARPAGAPAKLTARKESDTGKPQDKQGKQSKQGKQQSEAALSEKPEEQAAYTLQLSSFQDRAEAELFMEKLRETGMQPYMIPTTIPGRGVWYRVRIGSYTNWDEALAAKQSFESKQRIIAYVAKK